MRTTQAKVPARLHFIDALRAFAILMMLQGHFIDATLAVEYRDTSNLWFSGWAFMRGLTAPVFFTVTGLVFTYLLLGNSAPPLENNRWKKGIKRGFMLIGIGYLLKLNLPMLFTGYVPAWVFTTDVLQCIGIALLMIAGAFALTRGKKRWLGPTLLFAGLGIIAFDPSRQLLDLSGIPLLAKHYVTTDFGSTFTPFPWVAYSFMGALLGCFLRFKPRTAYGYTLPFGLFIAGLAIHFCSSNWLMDLFRLTEWENFKNLAYSNTLLMRGGQTMVLIAIFMFLVARLPKFPKLITTVGSETLIIYCGHYVILYGSVLGIGVASLLKESLSPGLAIFGAALLVFCSLTSMQYLPAIRQFSQLRWVTAKVAFKGSYPVRRFRRFRATV